jgi:hypothetical protein
MVPFSRPTSSTSLTKEAKVALLADYFAEYRALASENPSDSRLNVKVPRSVFSDLLDEIGTLLLTRADELSKSAGPVKDVLEENEPPGQLGSLLPREFRAYCLILNALKQWVAAEQAATDRYLLGGTARQTLRAIIDVCVLTGQQLSSDEVELHHPVRDGRPPIPVSKIAHAILEGQDSSSSERSGADQPATILREIKKQGNRSWVMLRRGCMDLLGFQSSHSTQQVGATSRSFAREAAAKSGWNYQKILDWLDRNQLGVI